MPFNMVRFEHAISSRQGLQPDQNILLIQPHISTKIEMIFSHCK